MTADPLDQLVGSWAFVMRHVQVPAPVTGSQRYEQVLDGAFLMLHWHYDHPDFPDAVAMLDARTCHYFDVRGVTRLYDLSVDDSGWRMIRRDDDFWQRSSARFLDGDRMDGSGENSFDRGATWQHDFSISFTRPG
jgi:hypothetical protein